MEVDNNTKPSSVRIWLDHNAEYFERLKRTAITETGELEAGDTPQMLITEGTHEIHNVEFYFSTEDGNIHLTMSLDSIEGNAVLSVDMPLSDGVFLDILQHAIKKFNRLKTVIEATK